MIRRIDQNDPRIAEINRRRKSLGVKKLKATPTSKWLVPIPVERAYQKALLDYVSEWDRLTEEILIKNLPSLVSEADIELMRTDSFGDSANRMILSLTSGISALKFPKQQVAENVGQNTNEFNEKQWEKIQKSAVGVSFFQSQPWLTPLMDSFVKENVTLITNMESDYIAKVDGIVQRGLRNGSRHETIAKEIQKQIGVSKNRAKLIGRDQVSKLNSQLAQRKQEGIGVKEYIWVTAGDERVRPTHRANNNKKFAWDNPPAVTGHPGEDVNCRCIAQPDFTPVLEQL